jgi:hypothetical protein
MARHLLAIVGYVVGTMAVQAPAHFALLTDHYAAVAHMSPTPLVPLGMASMVIQGAILTFVFSQSRLRDGTMLGAVKAAWLFGAFLVSYIALAEAAKYTVPSIPVWIATEVLLGFAQFTVIGLLLGLAHRVRTVAARA